LQKQVVERTQIIRELKKNQSLSDKPFIESQQEAKPVSDDIQNIITMLQKQLIEKTKTIREMSQSNNDQHYLDKISQLEELVTTLQKKILKKNNEITNLLDTNSPTFTRIPIQIEETTTTPSIKSKCEPEITVSAED
jgi:hypothetical protein